jgi:signal transduction histidine kinase
METSGETHRVLIVDDEPINIFFLEGTLTEEGFEVCTAENGAEALKKVLVFMPDAILLDIMMPEMSGIEVLDKLMEMPETRNIPVIMVTAKSEAEDVQLALSKGAIEYIKKPFNELEMLARLRTAIRLKLQEDHLRDLLRSRDELINMVSHDMRAPLLSVAGLAEMMLGDSELRMNSKHQNFLNTIINSSNFIIDYFNKLLNWSKLGARELTLSKQKFNLKELISSSQIVFLLRLEEKKQRLDIECDKDIQIFADMSFFQQVINNLLSNAIKYSPEGAVIAIKVEKGGASVICKVSDAGIGISDITPDELFGTTFHKSTKGTKGEKGTGVGLRICKMVTDAHGFGLTYKSEPNKGTEFVITIPQ